MQADYNRFVVPDLRQMLRERGLRATGNKPELIQRLQDDDTFKAALARGPPIQPFFPVVQPPAIVPVGKIPARVGLPPIQAPPIPVQGGAPGFGGVPPVIQDIPGITPQLTPQRGPPVINDADLYYLQRYINVPRRINEAEATNTINRIITAYNVDTLRALFDQFGIAYPLGRRTKAGFVNAFVQHVQNLQRGVVPEPAIVPTLGNLNLRREFLLQEFLRYPDLITTAGGIDRLRDQAGKMTIANLAEFFNGNGIPTENLRRKDDYINRFIEFVNTKIQAPVRLPSPRRQPQATPPRRLPSPRAFGGPQIPEPQVPGAPRKAGRRGMPELEFQPEPIVPPLQLTREQLLASVRQKVITNPLKDDAQLKDITQGYRNFDPNDPARVAGMITGHVYTANEAPFTKLDKRYAIEILMSKPDLFVNQVLTNLGYPVFTDATADDKLQLAWWEYIYETPDILSGEEKALVSNLTRAELLAILGPGYTYATDKASLVWALVKRQIPPRPDGTREPRYPEYLAMTPTIVARLAILLHNYYGTAAGIPSLYSPYRHLAIHEPSILDPFIIDYNGDADTFAQSVGMVIPRRNLAHEKYYLNNLQYYKDIFTRPENTLPPPDLTTMTPRQIRNALKIYTDPEIIDAYELELWDDWTSRPDLITRLITGVEEFGQGSRWTFRKRQCANDDTFNIVTVDPRDKNDPADPILSYGTLRNYKCYNISELEAVFREDKNAEGQDTGFQFAVPDWKKGQPMPTFPIASIRQLRDLLRGQNNPIYQPLLNKITQGFNHLNNANARIRQARTQLQGFSPENQAKVRDYLAWLFLAGMKMRFWKGPPTPYPTTWVEGGGRDELCTTAQRDINFQNWMDTRTRIISSMPQDIEQWVLQLPRVRYNFITGEGTLGQETIDFVIQKAQEGNFCLADGSDRVSQSGYFLTTNLLEQNNDQFNTFLREEMPRIYELYDIPGERVTLESLNRQANDPKTTDYATLSNLIKRFAKRVDAPAPTIQENKRSVVAAIQQLQRNLPNLQATSLNTLRTNSQNQPPFQPAGMGRTGHTDPVVPLQDIND